MSSVYLWVKLSGTGALRLGLTREAYLFYIVSRVRWFGAGPPRRWQGRRGFFDIGKWQVISDM